MIRFVALSFVLASVTGAAGYWLGAPANDALVWSSGPTVTHLETLGELVSTKVHIADVLIYESDKHRGSWLVRGDALISAELSKAKIAESDPTARTATIILPTPRVLSPRVDHLRTKTWDVKTTSWIPWGRDEDESKLRDEAMYHAQKLIAFAASSDENLLAARRTTENVIHHLYEMVGWSVTVEWESLPTDT